MFESINWIFEEPSVDDVTKYDLIALSIVYPEPNNVTNQVSI